MEEINSFKPKFVFYGATHPSKIDHDTTFKKLLLQLFQEKEKPMSKTQADGLKKIVPNAGTRCKINIVKKNPKPLAKEALYVSQLIKQGCWGEVIARVSHLEHLAQKHL